MKTVLHKMHVSNPETVKYTLDVEGEELVMSDQLGKHLKFTYDGEIRCMDCGEKTKKSFGNGFCWKCFSESPMAAECIIRPELCRGHLGEGRDVAWEQRNHVQEHYVYLALSSAVKIGVTRSTQVPTRWIDQGASKALIVAKTPNRYLAGVIEVAMKAHFTDKTNWRKMLSNTVLQGADLKAQQQKLKGLLPEEVKQYFQDDSEVLTINYPVLMYPEKVKSLNFDKTPVIEGELEGIKGQYLLFEGGEVLNIRKFTGYVVDLEIEE